MNLPRSIQRTRTAFDGPGPNLVLAGGEEADQAERLITLIDEFVVKGIRLRTL